MFCLSVRLRIFAVGAKICLTQLQYFSSIPLFASLTLTFNSKEQSDSILKSLLKMFKFVAKL
jgi:hypothetical protein